MLDLLAPAQAGPRLQPRRPHRGDDGKEGTGRTRERSQGPRGPRRPHLRSARLDHRKLDESVEHAMLSSAFARGRRVADEIERTRLITDISRLIRGSAVPEGARIAGLTLIGWLARRH